MITVKSLVDANIYNSEEAAINDALRHLLRSRPDLKIQIAVHRYQKEEISLEKAANLAGVSWAQMKEILMEKGVPVRLGAETIQEAREEIRVLREELARS